MEPEAVRYVVTFVLRGVQQDRLELTMSPEATELEPDARLQLEFSCDWWTSGELAHDDRIQWSLEDTMGLTLVSHEEVLREDGHVRAVARVDLDSRSVDRVAALLDVQAGSPVRARERRRIDIPVLPSIAVSPQVILVSRKDEVEASQLSTIALDVAEGWQVTAIDVPEWLTAEEGGGAVTLRAVAPPPLRRGTADVRITATSAAGQTVARLVRIVIDLEN
jgi:hypothetical protein